MHRLLCALKMKRREREREERKKKVVLNKSYIYNMYFTLHSFTRYSIRHSIQTNNNN